ncbi:unnamed protein product [Didymodactylos carnosus]|uniref:Uncharacterized protein n=1 Tax=Didymodactylos carnosus TaxID=1234261 RepID=A0A815BWP4_9BILA|nr:unnamed protein product [Didymodactylos carnosus]CAF1276114.1 unnamed protein product [Didymodactylos carnosus]CAF4049583.1 unnamed protein product [Didymodactylos carnosus]CAF4067691.1 unnamed protein product [Didymodactylos carnosus]
MGQQTSSVSEGTEHLKTISIKKADAYNNWDKYCCEALDNAKEYMSTKKDERFRSVDTAVIEARRLISYFGFEKFLIIVGLLISGVSVAAIIAILSGSGIVTAGVAGAGVVLLPIAVTGASIAAGGAAYHAWKIYTNKQLLIIIKQILVNHKTTFDENQPGLLHKPILNQLFVRCVKEIIVELYERKIFANG